MKKIIFLFSGLLLLACEEKNQVQETSISEGGPSFSDQLQVDTNRTVTLLPEARQQVIEWLAYATAQDAIQNLRDKTGTEIIGTSNSLMQIMENLRATLPDTLQTPAIESRANVLMTKSKVLHQLSTKKKKDAQEIFDVANDLIVEFDNFKLQLNELFLKSPVDFEEELDREFEEAQNSDTLIETSPDTTQLLKKPIIERKI